MDRAVFLFFFTLISILLDIYFYQIFKKYKLKKWFLPTYYIYWSVTSVTLLNFLFYVFDIELGYFFKTLFFNLVIGNFISKVVALPIILIDDIRRFFIKIYSSNKKKQNNVIPRSKFLSISASLAYGLPLTSLTLSLIHISAPTRPY